jgi:hypothetical protein
MSRFVGIELHLAVICRMWLSDCEAWLLAIPSWIDGLVWRWIVWREGMDGGLRMMVVESSLDRLDWVYIAIDLGLLWIVIEGWQGR